jgi:hypothetical protein
LGRLIVRFGIALFLVFIGSGLFFLLIIETTFNGGFAVSVKLLWLPLATIVFGFTYLNREMLQARSRRPWHAWAMAVALYPMMLLFAWPYVLAANALLASKGRIEFRGPIVAKFMSGGRGAERQVPGEPDGRRPLLGLLRARPARHSGPMEIRRDSRPMPADERARPRPSGRLIT